MQEYFYWSMLQNIQLFIPPNVIFDININTAQMNFLLLYLGFLKKKPTQWKRHISIPSLRDVWWTFCGHISCQLPVWWSTLGSPSPGQRHIQKFYKGMQTSGLRVKIRLTPIFSKKKCQQYWSHEFRAVNLPGGVGTG